MKNYRKSQSPQTAGKWFTQLVGCAQIYHLRWYVRPSGSPADGRLPLAGNRAHDVRWTSVLRRPERSEDSYTFSSADSVGSQRECHWHSLTPAVQKTHLPFCVLPPLGDLKDKSPRGESFTGFSAGGVCL